MTKATALLVLILFTMNPAPAVFSAQRARKPSSRTASNELRARIEQIAAAARGRVGASVLLIETGETISHNVAGRFPMQSVYKLPIAMAALARVDAGALKLDQRVRVETAEYVGANQRSPLRDEHPNGAEVSVGELLRLAVSESDGTASDVLLRLVGGAGEVMKYLRSLGVRGVIVRDTEREIGRDRAVQYRNWATPASAVNLLRALHEGRGLSQQSRTLLLRLMTETPTGLKRIKGRLPAGTPVAHKTGTSGTRDGVTAATNDIGIISLPDGRHLSVAVFVADARADQATREDVIARIAEAAWRWAGNDAGGDAMPDLRLQSLAYYLVSPCRDCSTTSRRVFVRCSQTRVRCSCEETSEWQAPTR